MMMFIEKALRLPSSTAAKIDQVRCHKLSGVYFFQLTVEENFGQTVDGHYYKCEVTAMKIPDCLSLLSINPLSFLSTYSANNCL